jgi:hypothetical protein
VILLWGLVQDAPLRLVRAALVQKGASFIFLNQADLLDTHVEVEYTPSVTGVLRLGDREYRLEDIRAMYLRPYDFREFPQLSPLDAQSSQWRHALAVEDVLWGFADVAQGVVVNRPSAMRSNSSKPYQCRLIEAHGFKVPETLITTDASAARWFRAQYREVVYKSISAQRSIVNRLSDEHESRMADLRWCPTQFQCWVPGVDHRVHVVGEQVFAVRVLSDDVDYRYGFARMEPCQLPDDVAARCSSMARGLGLRLAGIDLRRTYEGEWVCFEVNPSPAYSCYEFPDRRISLAVAGLLMGRRSDPTCDRLPKGTSAQAVVCGPAGDDPPAVEVEHPRAERLAASAKLIRKWRLSLTVAAGLFRMSSSRSFFMVSSALGGRPPPFLGARSSP